jgi:ferrochelatase
VSDSDLEYDSILLVSFGGPEQRADVMPFLENVVRGKNVPPERLKEVATHYNHFDGKSPINDQNRALIAALEKELETSDIDLPIYWGNRNWHPFIADTLRQMKADGKKRALAFVTSAYSSYSGCRQYREHIEEARQEVGEGAPAVDKLRAFYNHPGFIEANVDRLLAALETLPKERRESARVAFTAHSIPDAMAATCDYVEQLEETARLVAEGARHERWQLVYQSRSGPPQVPWLGPDIVDHLDALAQISTKDVVVAPIGFVSDHMEVVWDLDHEAREHATELGITLTRAETVGTHPAFVAMIRELIEERLGRVTVRQALGKRGPYPDVCPPDCCNYKPRASRPAPEAG